MSMLSVDVPIKSLISFELKLTRRKVLMEPRLMTTEDAAAYLSISPGQLKKHGPVPIRIGGSVRYDRHALDAWIDQLGGGSDGGNDAEAQALAALK